MATIQFKKGDEYLQKLSRLDGALRDEICGAALHSAAGIVADEIRAQLEKVPTDEDYGTADNPTNGPKKIQKLGLADSLGIAGIKSDGTGFLNVKIGFDGYNKLKTERWPNGQPNQMVARSVERGTSYMKGNPFVKKAVSASRKRALEAMESVVDEAVADVMK